MGKKDDMIFDVVDAFEESTGRVPNDYEMGEINALVRAELEEEES